MKILVINGPNINMLGIREPDIYGKETFSSLEKKIKAHCAARGIRVKLFQSNCEGKIVSEIQKAYKKFDGIVINPAAYTHTSTLQTSIPARSSAKRAMSALPALRRYPVTERTAIRRQSTS